MVNWLEFCIRVVIGIIGGVIAAVVYGVWEFFDYRRKLKRDAEERWFKS